MDVIEELRLLVSDVLDVEPSAVSPASGRATLAAWDSLAHLRIVAAAEEAFAVRFTMQEINEVGSLGEMGALIAERRA